MSAEFVSDTVNPCSIDQLMMTINAACRESAFHTGHTQTGELGSKMGTGITVFDPVMANEEEAERFLRKHLSEDNGIGAIRFKSPVIPVFDKAIAQAQAELDELHIALVHALPRRITQRSRADQPSHRTCLGCTSQIAMTNLDARALSCPVCRHPHFLYEPADVELSEQLSRSMSEKRRDIAQMEKKKADRADDAVTFSNAWLYGAWCPT